MKVFCGVFVAFSLTLSLLSQAGEVSPPPPPEEEELNWWEPEIKWRLKIQNEHWLGAKLKVTWFCHGEKVDVDYISKEATNTVELNFSKCLVVHDNYHDDNAERGEPNFNAVSVKVEHDPDGDNTIGNLVFQNTLYRGDLLQGYGDIDARLWYETPAKWGSNSQLALFDVDKDYGVDGAYAEFGVGKRADLMSKRCVRVKTTDNGYMAKILPGGDSC